MSADREVRKDAESKVGRKGMRAAGREDGNEMRQATGSGCSGEVSALPKGILSIMKRSISLFMSNLKPRILEVELEAMFCRAGQIMDSFIPVNKSTRQGRGFAFVRFESSEEANRAVVDINGIGLNFKGFLLTLF